MRTPCLAAASKAPAFSIKLRSLHVSPLSQKMTGIGEPLPALGSMTENFIVQPSTALACSYLCPGQMHGPGFEGRDGTKQSQCSELAVVLYACSALRPPSFGALTGSRWRQTPSCSPSQQPSWILCNWSHELGNGRSAVTVGHAHCAMHTMIHHVTSRSVASRYIMQKGTQTALHLVTSRYIMSYITLHHAERHAGTHKRVRPQADARAALLVTMLISLDGQNSKP